MFTRLENTGKTDYIVPLKITLTVNASQGIGTYRLADGVRSFTGSIMVKSGDTDLGVVSLVDPLASGGREYVLSLEGSTLQLDVSATEGGVEELLQSSLSESSAVAFSSSGAIEEFAGSLSLGVASEESFGAASLFDFESSTKTAGALLAV